MAMSRSFGGTSFTTRPPMAMSPEEIFSSPAIIRNNVDLPQPDGPTRMTNSPSSIPTDTPCSTSVEPNALRTLVISTPAITGSELGHAGFLAGDELQQSWLAGLGLFDAPGDCRLVF